MATTLNELRAAAKEFHAARQGVEAARTRFDKAMHVWDKAVEYADGGILNTYYAGIEKSKNEEIE